MHPVFCRLLVAACSMLLLKPVSCYGQQAGPCGAFLRDSDFICAKVMPAGAKHLRVFSPGKPGFICIRTHAGRTRLSTDSLFGYRDKHGACYRFDHATNNTYRILECGTVIIYASTKPGYGSKNFRQYTVYSFSRSLRAPVVPLTLLNLKRAFPENYTLHHLLDIEFGDIPVSAFDTPHSMFRINFILQQHVNATTHP